MLTRLILAVLLMIFTLTGFCQSGNYDPTHLFAVKELQTDLQFVRKALERTHPDLYRYTPKEKIDFFFDSLYRDIVKPLSEMEFYNVLTLINAKVKDGHTLFLPGREALNYFNHKSKFLPFYITLLDNKLYVRMNCSADTLVKAGDEIVSINQIDVKDILHNLLIRQIRDGYNQTYPAWILTTYFKEYFGFLSGHPDTFSITYKTRNADSMVTTIHALSKDSIKFYRDVKYSEKSFMYNEKQKIILQMNKQSSIATLTIKSFDSDVLQSLYKQNVSSTLAALFTRIHNAHIQNLILDLRNNQGGDFEPGKRLLSYLLRHPLTYLPGSEEEEIITPKK